MNLIVISWHASVSHHLLPVTRLVLDEFFIFQQDSTVVHWACKMIDLLARETLLLISPDLWLPTSLNLGIVKNEFPDRSTGYGRFDLKPCCWKKIENCNVNISVVDEVLPVTNNGWPVLYRFIWTSAHSALSHLIAVKLCYIISMNQDMQLDYQHRMCLISRSKCFCILLFLKSLSEKSASVFETCHVIDHWLLWRIMALIPHMLKMFSVNLQRTYGLYS